MTDHLGKEEGRVAEWYENSDWYKPCFLASVSASALPCDSETNKKHSFPQCDHKPLTCLWSVVFAQHLGSLSLAYTSSPTCLSAPLLDSTLNSLELHLHHPCPHYYHPPCFVLEFSEYSSVFRVHRRETFRYIEWVYVWFGLLFAWCLYYLSIL